MSSRYRRTAWRRGFGTEAARAGYGYGQIELMLENVEARVHQENVASLRIIEFVSEQLSNDASKVRRKSLRAERMPKG